MVETASVETVTVEPRSLTMRVTDLVVDYEVFEDRRAALRQRFVTKRGSGRSFVHALKGMSFDAYEGDTIGVVGPNGSGKSTLLAAVAGLLPPTSGEILVADEPKLLGVGATLIAAATGFRNIRLGCMALGMTAAEIDERIAAIVEFTGLGEAINRPLRTYSSGMRARLHFAIATSVQPRILLIDEALAVGDKAFRAKSAARIGEIVERAGTLVLVSHSMDEIARLCARVLWIDDGRLVADGPTAEVLERYDAS
jgi:ABC-type polysaccharide/polyol phosphate transport system ATPase subunit